MSREVEMQCNQVDVTLAFKLMQYGHTLCTGNTKESSDTRWSLGSLFKSLATQFWVATQGLQISDLKGHNNIKLNGLCVKQNKKNIVCRLPYLTVMQRS